MAIRKTRPTSAGKRFTSYDDYADLTTSKPEKSLLVLKKQHGGRNNQGKITVRHQGGGVKRMIRLVDFKRDKFEVPGRIATIEYDPNRGARIALVNYVDGEKRYIIAPTGIALGNMITSSKNQIDVMPGNTMPIKFIPAGIMVHNIELQPGQGAKIARGAGSSVQVMGVEGEFAQIKMPSGEIRKIKKECLCTIGQVGNADKIHIKIGTAGRQRKLGVRPTVRGKAMNPNDHPHGGGEGRQSIGLKHPKTKWGKPALGVKTRRKKKQSSKLIIQRRKNRK
jgi:large subunit ribosomal protein L2